jgi:electron transfer flavoprotein beta subunit
MHVLVLLAGIVDPNVRLTESRIAALCAGANEDETRKLSPFDEAALETALQLRSSTPGTQITAALFGTEGSDKLLRFAAALRPDHMVRLNCPSSQLWDAATAGAQVAALLSGLAVAGLPAPDLVLIGREFGDCDNGMLPPYLAEAGGWPFVGQVQQMRAEAGVLVMRRTRGSDEEEIRLPPPLFVSIVNDRGNRLRHPLMKNVMLARRETWPVLDGALVAGDRHLLSAAASTAAPRTAGCQWLEGTVDEQADALAGWLLVQGRR